MKFISGKNYGHELGLSCTFRQWRAKSHCNREHGYALAFEFSFETEHLDNHNWVVDFGSMKPVKEWLYATFDHKKLVAHDDPQIDYICMGAGLGVCDVTVVPGTGCETFAYMAHNWVNDWIKEESYLEQPVPHSRVRLTKTICREHAGNWAGVQA